MGFFSGLLGNTPLATSAMKGTQTGEYGQNGIVGTLLKMWAGGTLGDAAGGADGVPSGSATGKGSTGGTLMPGATGSSSGIASMGDTIYQGMTAGDIDWSKIAGQGLNQALQNGNRSPQPAPNMMPMVQQQQSNGLESLLSQANQMAPQQGNGLMQTPGIPDYFLNMMRNWQ